ncbi:MAG: hypothetical protein RIC19_00100 [Phaeodactylibacter sp.]|uniref:hypothetical protein n=1 Tax=Phaeodactylibacter sp. TaxID=1940289 RepID=UPI0032EF409A
MPIEKLKKDLWEKVFRNKNIEKHSHYYSDIRDAIKEKTGFHLSRDTIRNLMEDRNRPSPKMLDIYATFLLDGCQDQPFTFQDYLEYCQQQPTLAETKQQVPSPDDSPKRHKLVFIALPICSLLFVLLFSLAPQKTKSFHWTEGFHNNSPAGLHDRGWKFICFDSTHWNQIRSGVLTLFTQYGEYSSNLIDSTVHNLVYKKLDCTHCEITVKIVDFNPSNRYQQAAVFLLDSNLTRTNNLRFSFATMNPDTFFEHRTQAHRVEHKRGVQVLNQVEGRTVHFTKQLHTQIYDKEEQPIAEKEIWLKMKITPDHYQTAYMINDSIGGFTSFAKDQLHFDPKYIGLACLGNGVRANTCPSTAEDIPAYFDYVRVEKAPNDL